MLSNKVRTTVKYEFYLKIVKDVYHYKQTPFVKPIKNI